MGRNTLRNIIVLGITSIALSSNAELTTTNARFNLDVEASVLGTTFADEVVLSKGPTAAGPLFDDLPSNVADRVQIDAFNMPLSLSTILLSSDVDFTIGVFPVADEDVLVYFPISGVLTQLLDMSSISVPAATDLDGIWAATLVDELLLSFDTTVTLSNGVGTVTVDDDDIIQLDLLPSVSFSKLYDGVTDLGIPEAADVDALHLDGPTIALSTTLYFSLDITATINGSTGNDHDIWAYDIASMLVSLVTNKDVESRADLVSLDSIFDTDGDGLSDYEEISGKDEGGTTVPGTDIAMVPTTPTDPTIVDSDGDGVPDNEEAIAGTVGTNGVDYLRMTAIDQTGNTNVLTWSSVSTRLYVLEQAATPTSSYSLVAENIAGAVTETSYSNAASPKLEVYRVRVDYE